MNICEILQKYNNNKNNNNNDNNDNQTRTNLHFLKIKKKIK